MTHDEKQGTDDKGIGSNDGLGDCQHELEKVYYGDKCKKCGVFYPDSSNPWDTVCRHGKYLDDVCLLCYFGAGA